MAGTTVSGLARTGGVGIETVRYYQRRGLMRVPDRNGGGMRRYDEDDLHRLRFIRHAQTAGFTLDEIAELLALDSTEDRPRARELAQGRIAALNNRISQLEAARDALERLAVECGSGTSGPCPILAAFNHD